MSRYQEALTQLQSAQKPSLGAPPYSRWVNRPLGRRFAAAAYAAGLRPNNVTIISAVFTFSALAVMATQTPRPLTGIAVAALLVIGYALDAADGQLARLLGGGSLAGEWLDHLVDATKTVLLHSAVLVMMYRFFDLPDWRLLVPLGYQAVSCVFFFTFILMEQLRKRAGKAIHPSTSTSTSGRRDLFQSVVALPTDYGVLCVVFVLIGWHDIFATVYTAMFALNAIVLAGALWRWWNELQSLDSRA